jgi:hypothetical protein
VPTAPTSATRGSLGKIHPTIRSLTASVGAPPAAPG